MTDVLTVVGWVCFWSIMAFGLFLLAFVASRFMR